MSLRFKLLFPFALLLTLAVITIHFIWLPDYIAQKSQNIKIMEKTYMQLLAEAITPDLLSGDLATIHNTLDIVLEKRSDWSALILKNSDGVAIYPLDINTESESANGRLEWLELSFHYDKTLIGQILVSIDIQELVNNDIQGIINLEYLLFVFLALVSVASILLQELWIRRPIKKLALAAAAIARGKYQPLLSLASNDEIGSFYRTFDRMRVKLEKREETLRQFQKAIEEAGHAICITDKSGTIQHVNPAFSSVTGYSQKDALGKNPNIIKSGKHDEKYYIELWEAILAGHTWKKDIINRRKNGETYHAEQSISPILDNSSEIVGFVAIQMDVTEQREMSQKLKEAKEAAELANRAKSEFLANMSHEIRTPMNSVIGFSELLNSMITDAKQKNYIESIQTAGKSLLKLINDILDLSKVEAGMLEIQYEAISLDFLIREIEQIFKIKLEEKNLDFIVNIDPELPKAMMLDEVRLRQALINLVGNATKFTDAGYIKISAGKEYKNDDHSKTDIIIAVEDTGIGIPEDQREIIFESFRQQDGQSARKFGGTGLGLSLTKKLIEMMNGAISVESSPDQGSVFTVHLRGVDVSSISFPVNTKKEDFDIESYSFESSLVMVVDDIESNRTLIREALSRNGLEILEADNGQNALIFAEEHHPKIIFMDIRMPVMDGYEALRELKANPKTTDIPVVALTASVSNDQNVMLNKFGFDGYLAKPIDMPALYKELSLYIKTQKGSAKKENSDDTPAGEMVAANIRIAPELISKLENDIWKSWEIVKNDGVFDNIEEFGKKLFELGEKHGVPALRQFGDDLISQTENFDVDGMNETLKSYPSLIEELKKRDTLEY